MSATLPIEAQELAPQEALALARDLMAWAIANGAGDPSVVRLEYPITVKGAGGAGQSKTFNVLQWEQVQKAFATEFPDVSTQDASLVVEVVSGTIPYDRIEYRSPL